MRTLSPSPRPPSLPPFCTDQTAAMVMSRSVGTLRTFDPVNSIDVLVSGGMRSGSTLGMRNAVSNVDQDMQGVRREPSFASRAALPGGGNTANGSGLASSITWSKAVSADPEGGDGRNEVGSTHPGVDMQ